MPSFSNVGGGVFEYGSALLRCCYTFNRKGNIQREKISMIGGFHKNILSYFFFIGVNQKRALVCAQFRSVPLVTVKDIHDRSAPVGSLGEGRHLCAKDELFAALYGGHIS